MIQQNSTTCLLPHIVTSRQLIVSPENIIHSDDFFPLAPLHHCLLPCNKPTQSVNPLQVIKHRSSAPHHGNDTSNYAALSKQPDS